MRAHIHLFKPPVLETGEFSSVNVWKTITFKTIAISPKRSRVGNLVLCTVKVNDNCIIGTSCNIKQSCDMIKTIKPSQNFNVQQNTNFTITISTSLKYLGPDIW